MFPECVIGVWWFVAVRVNDVAGCGVVYVRGAWLCVGYEDESKIMRGLPRSSSSISCVEVLPKSTIFDGMDVCRASEPRGWRCVDRVGSIDAVDGVTEYIPAGMDAWRHYASESGRSLRRWMHERGSIGAGVTLPCAVELCVCNASSSGVYVWARGWRHV